MVIAVTNEIKYITRLFYDSLTIFVLSFFAGLLGWKNGLVHKETFVGSNHLTIRNDANTKIALKELLDGRYSHFFYTEKSNKKKPH